jgi:tRNA(Leu) C34 or U34 (ribose-2'-O)-methylase TrmL
MFQLRFDEFHVVVFAKMNKSFYTPQEKMHLCKMKTVIREGYCAIGVFRGKTEHNLGTLWRTAYILGASYIFTIDHRYKKQPSDVLKTWARIPLFHYRSFDDFSKNIPYDCRLVGVELTEDATDLHAFQHPRRAIYLLGAEDSGLSDEILKACQHRVRLHGNSSLNVAVSGSIVLHDRASKVPTTFPPLHTK